MSDDADHWWDLLEYPTSPTDPVLRTGPLVFKSDCLPEREAVRAAAKRACIAVLSAVRIPFPEGAAKEAGSLKERRKVVSAWRKRAYALELPERDAYLAAVAALSSALGVRAALRAEEAASRPLAGPHHSPYYDNWRGM